MGMVKEDFFPGEGLTEADPPLEDGVEAVVFFLLPPAVGSAVPAICDNVYSYDRTDILN